MTIRPFPLSFLFLFLTLCIAGPALQGCEPAGENVPVSGSTGFVLNERDYFENGGVSVTAYEDTFPESRQSGVIVISHGTRIASNGGLRLEPTPGQWSPVPKLVNRRIDRGKGIIRATLAYPDESQNRTGFNPLYYPDLELAYEVSVSARGDAIDIRVDLDQPLPPEWAGKVGFNLELSPADLFGKTWFMDEVSGIFPRQPYGVRAAPDNRPDPRLVPEGPLKGLVPLPNHRAEPVPLATGRRLSVAPATPELHLMVESHGEPLQLLDGRVQHQNGWFVVRSPVAAGAADNAVHWTLQPNVVEGWMPPPVIQHSMVGYHPAQKKVAVIEAHPDDALDTPMRLLRLLPNGREEVVVAELPKLWGDFLRYRYYHFDFSQIVREGMYQLVLRGKRSAPFSIAADVYNRNVWQPTLEYFLPVQMDHMRVKEKYKLWHGSSHLDDALMAPTDINHFDGYVQGASTLTDYRPGEHVPGLDRGGWYDAGDADMRIESQTGTIFMLSAIFDEFDVRNDTTLVDQRIRLVELREPDGVPDVLQQIEHGLLTVLGGYRSLGRLYRGIIVPTLTQYVMGGDFAGHTDNLIYNPDLGLYERTATHSGLPDDRWVFTEENPAREFDAIANMTASVGPMRVYDNALADETLAAAAELWKVERPVDDDHTRRNKIRAAVELFRVTGQGQYREYILSQRGFILEHFDDIGWAVARVVHNLDDEALVENMRKAAAELYGGVRKRMDETPYGVTLDMGLWGEGWDLQREGVAHYFLHKAFPDAFGTRYLQNILHYVLGTNPGANPQSYVSGVGARSKTSAYGFNRMDYGYIPGGAIVGTGLIAPDFPELKEFPYLWHQSEYVIGGGATNFVFLALAADRLLNDPKMPAAWSD